MSDLLDRQQPEVAEQLRKLACDHKKLLKSAVKYNDPLTKTVILQVSKLI